MFLSASTKMSDAPCAASLSAAPLGIFGGTFDPVHLGHLRLAEEAADCLGLQAVRWIPAGRPAHRRPPQADPAQRLAMVQLAVAGNARFEVDPAESEALTPSYTVPTLERLRLTTPCASRPLVLLLGADAFTGLSTWHRWEHLFDLAHIAVAHRPGFPIDVQALAAPLAAHFRRRYSETPASLGASPAGSILSFAMTPLAISATQIRELIAGGRSPRYLLPDSLIAYIQKNLLYSPQ